MGSRPQRRPQRRLTPQTAADWGAVAPIWLGVAGLVFQLLLWAVTALLNRGHGIVEPAFVTAFGGLLAVGQGAQAISALRSAPPDPRDDEEQ